MDKRALNFWIDAGLMFLLALAICSLEGPHEADNGMTAGVKVYCVHALSAIFMTCGALLHIFLHRRWFKIALRRKAKGRVRKCVFGGAMLLACLSGYSEISSPGPSLLHHAAGIAALVGLLLHSVTHLGWMIRYAASSLRPSSPACAGSGMQGRWR